MYAIPSFGQAFIELDRFSEDISINNFAFISKNHKATINDIDKIATAPNTDFIKNENFREVNFGFDQPTGWCKFTVKNTSDRSNWIVNVHQAKVDTVQLYVKKGNEAMFKYPVTGHFQNIIDRAYYSVHFANQIVLKKNETATFYLYTQRKFGRHVADISMHQEKHFIRYNGFFAIYISVICGIVLLAGLVGIVLNLFVYRKVYIFYSFYCFAFLLLLLTDTGFLHAYFNNAAYPDLMNNTNFVFYYWAVGWHILFTIELLSLDKKSEKWLYFLGYLFGIVFCIFAIILLIPVPDIIRKYLSLWSYYIVFIADAYILFAIFAKISKNKTIAYYYLAGFACTMILASVLTLADLQIIPEINPNSDYFFFIPVIEILFMVIGLGIHFSNIIKEKLNTQLQLNETQNEIISIQEYERKRIAQDLHDDVGNSLMALKNILIHNKESHNIEGEIDNILNDIRNISHNLMPVDFSEYDLTDIIRQTINKFKNHPTTCFEFDETGKIIKLKSDTELIIYRIVNELISNITKHAAASHALIQIIYQEESLIIMAEDNGLGMKNKNILEKNGLGLYNIKHRVAYINGQINIESDQKGTLVIIEIPYAKNS
jgi:signal transduction histidine kinase